MRQLCDCGAEAVKFGRPEIDGLLHRMAGGRHDTSGTAIPPRRRNHRTDET